MNLFSNPLAKYFSENCPGVQARHTQTYWLPSLNLLYVSFIESTLKVNFDEWRKSFQYQLNRIPKSQNFKLFVNLSGLSFSKLCEEIILCTVIQPIVNSNIQENTLEKSHHYKNRLVPSRDSRACIASAFVCANRQLSAQNKDLVNAISGQTFEHITDALLWLIEQQNHSQNAPSKTVA